MDSEKKSKSETIPTSPPKNQTVFNPDEVYYSTETGSYFVDAGTFYRNYSRKSPVKNGIRRWVEIHGGKADDCKHLVDMHTENIEIDRAVDWSGKLAGSSRGVTSYGGRRFLITDGYDIPDSAVGPCPLHLEILKQAFPKEDSLLVFTSWLADAVKAIRSGNHQPAPMMVLAGERNAGKSLLAHITKQAMGGRSANPMTAWTGQLPWNDNLLGSELLLIDDSVASTDPRARKAFGARFKEAIYAGGVEINTRRKTSISMRPVWRVMVCCNETPENLSVIPPLEDGIEDKIILLKVSPIKTPMPACDPQEKELFASALQAELPAFLRFLEKAELPEHLRDSRSGVTAWKDQELYDAVTEISPERRLENLLHLSISKGFMNLLKGEGEWMSATEVQEKLQDRDSATYHQANTLLKYDANAGRYLSALAKSGSPFVTGRKLVHGITHYQITRPE